MIACAYGTKPEAHTCSRKDTAVNKETRLKLIVQARWLHRAWRDPDGRHLINLPGTTAAALLGRTWNRGPGIVTCDMDTDHITFGLSLVWKTGGKELCQLALDTATEDDLLRCDFATEYAWRMHILNGRGPYIPEHTPQFYRNGEKQDRDNVLERMQVLLGQLPPHPAG